MAQSEEKAKRSWADNRLVRLAANLLMVGVVLYLGFLIWQRSQQPGGLLGQAPTAVPDLPVSAPIPSVEPSAEADANGEISLSPLGQSLAYNGGVLRKTSLDTVIPSRTRTEVITYTVKTGDNLFVIAEKYGIEPETVLWGNFETLEDNPQFLTQKQVLNILPVDGVYYQWQDGDTVAAVAGRFNVEPQAIIGYSGNDIDLTETISGTLGIHTGDWIIVPGGTRPLKDWGPPAISRDNPAVAKYYGDGFCGQISSGAYGTGSFIWPTTDRSISGYNYTGIHPALDIGGAIGNPVVAADSGVVVFAGWSNYGYGNLVVIDHGNGWQTAYAHLDSYGVGCGQSVGQGGYIGGLGSTGNSTGPHLHFELVFNGSKPNPLDYLR